MGLRVVTYCRGEIEMYTAFCIGWMRCDEYPRNELPKPNLVVAVAVNTVIVMSCPVSVKLQTPNPNPNPNP